MCVKHFSARLKTKMPDVESPCLPKPQANNTPIVVFGVGDSPYPAQNLSESKPRKECNARNVGFTRSSARNKE